MEAKSMNHQNNKKQVNLIYVKKEIEQVIVLF